MKRLLWVFLIVLFCFFIINTNSAEAAARLFGTIGYGVGQTSTLIELDPNTGATIQVIGPVGYLVNGLDYDPTTNKLYGGTSWRDPNFSGLIEIDMTTGAGTPIGADDWGGFLDPQEQEAVTNITVDSAGHMYGWSEADDSLVSIDKNTGVASEVEGSHLGTMRYGLSFNSTDVLYLVNSGGEIYRINTVTGANTYEGGLGQSAHHGDFDPETDLYYGLTYPSPSSDPRTLLRCDLAAHSCTAVGTVGDLHTLAFVGGCTAPPNGLVSWWPGEGNGGDIIDGNNGTVNGATFAPGKVGQAFSFDGVNDYVSTNLDVQPTAMPVSTWEAWVFPTRVNYGIRQTILSDDDGGFDRSVIIEFNTSNFAIFTGSTGGGVWQPTTVDVNQWQHIAVVWTPTNIYFYKNGVAYTYGGAPTGQSTTNKLNIGRNPGFGQYFQGIIDEVGIYDRALDPEEINAIYDAGAAGKCKPCTTPPSGLVSWWPGDGNGSDIIGGNEGTLQGGANFAPGKVVGQAFSFNGGVDAVAVPASTDLNVQSLTIDAWIFPKTIGLPGGMPIVEWNNGATFGVHFWLYPNNEDIFANLVTTGGSYNYFYTKKITLDAWNHVALTYDKNTGLAKLYVNGGQVAQTNFGSLNLQTSYPLFIGRRPAGGLDRSFNGLIDEVEIFNRALSADEILAIYNAGSSGKCGPHFITSTAGPNGTIYPEGKIPLSHGMNLPFTITPAPDYHIEDVLVDGVSVGAVSSYTFVNIKTDHTIHATFAVSIKESYTIDASASPNGSISPLGTTTLKYGESQTYTITPKEGYRVVDVLVDNKSTGPHSTYTFSAINANHIITAIFLVETPVVIPGITPPEGTIGTEITITGSSFGLKAGRVLIGRTRLKVLGWNTDSILCRLTKALEPGSYDVTVQPKGAPPIVYNNGFTVKAPEIVSIDTTSGSARERVSINGNFFGTKKGHVYLGYEVNGKPRKKSCSVPSWTMNPTTNEGQIVFVVPRLTPGTYDLIVTNSVGSDTLIQGFTIK